MKELNKKLAIVQTKLKAKKSSYNSFGKYYFRKSEDILEAIKPFLIEHGVTVTINEEIIATDPVPTIQSTATISDGKNAIHATALVGVDLNQKGMQTRAVACIAFSPSENVAVDCIVGTGSVAMISSLIVTVTPCLTRKGFIASRMSSDLRK